MLFLKLAPFDYFVLFLHWVVNLKRVKRVRGPMFEPAIIVHGGCGVYPREESLEPFLAGVKDAALQGHALLSRAGSAVDAVEAAVSVLEDNPLFNSGRGSVLNLDGQVEMDAIVIDGQTLGSGAVCGLRRCANPAWYTLRFHFQTRHCLLTGAGAQEFMRSQGIPEVPDSYLVVPRRRLAWEKTVLGDQRSPDTATASELSPGCDTVGAVAMDATGNVAAATSTGGTTAKLPGRVGDSPIIGAGAYADSDVGAVSTTGDGESIMKVCLARRTVELLEQSQTV
ncbi:hypothetical protein EGW08_010312 [Elysia chlorotica]|uniref:Asparaginase n=1 Tax=Elysia chlorotica TaxID=188477 RepID=A0A3S1HLH3_ELYCH|nr:hypothetical protein EGW08_010312 [Elysia chlorotica]